MKRRVLASIYGRLQRIAVLYQVDFFAGVEDSPKGCYGQVSHGTELEKGDYALWTRLGTRLKAELSHWAIGRR